MHPTLAGKARSGSAARPQEGKNGVAADVTGAAGDEDGFFPYSHTLPFLRLFRTLDIE